MSRNTNLSGNLFTKQALTPTETSISASIAQWLNAHRIYSDRLNSGKVLVIKGSYQNWMTLCRAGTPDRFAIVKGHIVFIEVKKRGKKPSDDQLARHAELRASGATVIVADSIDSFIDQFKPLL